jgi:hypothetical protein
MRKQASRLAVIGIAAWITILVAAAQQPPSTGQSAAQQSGTVTPKAQPDPMPQEKAMHPAPSGNAQRKTQKNSVGKGALTVTTAQPVDFWQEQVAYSGGNTVTTDFLYNPNVGVVYGYREDDFKCANGQPAHGGILEARFTRGNQANKPVGSGWYAVELDAGKCAAKESTIYGCKFDASGNPSECGTAVINSQTGDIAIATVQ